MSRRLAAAALVFALGAAAGAIRGFAQVAMPNAKEMSGVVLPVSDVPAGTVTVRVVRGSLGNDIVDHPVEFTVAGRTSTVRTDGNGRAQVANLPAGTRVRAVAVVDGERLESQEAVVGQTGLRIMLVATDPEAAKRAEEDRRLAASEAVKGTVAMSPETRVVIEMSSDRLHVYYLLHIVNSARVPVDIGGPLVFDLPREARGSVVIEGSSPQATANGPRITVVGPFAPGTTQVQAAYEMPYSRDVARITQAWPAGLPQVTVLVQQLGGLELRSSQLTVVPEVTREGQPILLGTGPGLAPGESLSLEIAGLPFHPRWPRNLALALAVVIVLAGFWGAFTAPARRRT